MREPTDNIRETAAAAVRASPVAGLIRALTHPWGERTWLRVYSVAVAMAAFMGFTGAMGTDVFDGWTRFTFWLIMMLGGTLIVQLVCLIFDSFLRLAPLPEAIVQFIVTTPLITVFVWAVAALFTGRAIDPANLPAHLLPVAVITAAMSALQYALNHRPRQTHEFAPQSIHAEPGKALRDRLSFKYRQAEIYALSAEDHYLRVHTSAGETLILMRLYDAIRELDGIEGSQTHRSWWVAKSAVRDIERADGKLNLRIEGGVSVPVSRSYQKALKDGGWF